MRHHSQVTPLHLLAALLDQQDGIVAPVLGKIGVAPKRCAPMSTPP